MVNYPGWFASVELAAAVSTGTGGDSIIGGLDVAGLNFALVLHEDAPPLAERFTTWGLQADCAIIYQTLAQPNQMLIGDAGNIYVLTDAQHHDDGHAISLIRTSIPYPIPSQDAPLTSPKRLWDVMWQVRTAPPAAGYLVTVSATDVDNPANTVSRTLTQTQARVIVRLPLSGVRQWVFRWDLTTDQDYDIISLGYKYQVLQRRYARYQ